MATLMGPGWDTWYQTRKRLTRRKVGDQHYAIVLDGKLVVGDVVKTGTHLDDYPWDASGEGPIENASLGSHDTLKSAIDEVASRLVRDGAS